MTIRSLAVRTAKAVEIPVLTDPRGVLTVAEARKELPFVPARYFTLQQVPGGARRGEHAHHTLHQFIVCLHGACRLHLDDGRSRDSLMLDTPGLGIHVEPRTWCVLEEFTPDAVVLVLASAGYDPGDYIRDYQEFRQAVESP